MSRHEGVSCDSCLKNNFCGRRYKCLICYDYDLCANCFEEGTTNARHSTDHPVQCILTRSDFELYYGGEVLISDQPQSFTCPYCKKMGFSDSTLFDHVTAEHTDTGLEIVCPVCAALPGGDPNLVTDDFAGHLTLEHRTGSRDLISFLDEPSAIRHGGVRRIPHAGRALGGPRSRRANMHFSSTSGLSALSPSGAGNGGVGSGSTSGGTGIGATANIGGRDSVDPIAELLSQLSGVRRGVPQPSQLQQLQMQIQLERQQVTAARQQLERIPRRQPHPSSAVSAASANLSNFGGTSVGITAHQVIAAGGSQAGIAANSIIGRGEVAMTSSTPIVIASTSGGTSSSFQANSQFLLNRMMPTFNDTELAQIERDRADRSQYVQALLLSTLSKLSVTTRKQKTIDLTKAINNNNTTSSSQINDDEDNDYEDNSNNNVNINDSTGKLQQNSNDEIVKKDSFNSRKNNNNCNVNDDSSQNNINVHRGGGGGSISKKGSSTNKSGGGGGGCVGSNGGGGGGIERRNDRRTPQSAKGREFKQTSNTTNTKDIPDSR